MIYDKYLNKIFSRSFIMVKISIIMPVFNASQYIENACLSVYNQTLHDIELICINDGSTDNSLEVLHFLEEKYDFIKVFSQENAGSGYARNNGISKASGEYIAFLDADDIFLDDDALEKMYFYAIQKDADMVGANLKVINLDGSIDENYDFENTDFKYFEKKDVILPIEYGIPFAFYRNIYKKELIDNLDIKFPDLSRGQDPIFLTNVLINIDEIYVLNTDLYGYNKYVSGGVNLKVNTYQKKYDYINHFRITLDLLKNNGFEKAYEGYKKEFINYLTFGDNMFDEDIKKIMAEFSTEFEKHFDENGYSRAYLSIFNDEINLDELNVKLNDFTLIKQCLFEETLINDNFIDENYLREYVSIISDKNVNNEDFEKLSLIALKKVENSVQEDYEFLSNDLKDINDEINRVDKSNMEILKSNSWKLTKFLRTMKHFYKNW